MAEETHPQEQHSEQKEEKKQSTLESVIGELGSFARKALLIGTVAVTPLVYNFIAPAQVPLAQVTSYSYAASKITTNIIQEKKDPLEGIVRNSFNGALLSYPIAEGFKGLNSLETSVRQSYGTVAAKVAKGAGMAFGLQPAVVAGNTALNYGLGKKFRESVWPNVKRAFYLIAIPGIINVNWLYQAGLFVQMSVSAGLSFLLNYSQAMGEGKGNVKNLYNALNPAPYISAGINSTYKLAKTAVSPLQAIYEIGSGLYKSASKHAASPTSAQPAAQGTAPHHA